jgi:hypothetical protein
MDKILEKIARRTDKLRKGEHRNKKQKLKLKLARQRKAIRQGGW